MDTNHYAHLTDSQRELLFDHYDNAARKFHRDGNRYGQFKALSRRSELESPRGVWLSRLECQIAGIDVDVEMYA